MQRDLDALMDWGSTWGMKFNAEKCNIMRVSRSRKPLQHFYSLGNEILQEVQWCSGNFSLVGTLAWHGHIYYCYRGGGGGRLPKLIIKGKNPCSNMGDNFEIMGSIVIHPACVVVRCV